MNISFFILFFSLLFIVVLIRQVIITAITMWTGYLLDVPYQPTQFLILETLVKKLPTYAEQAGSTKQAGSTGQIGSTKKIGFMEQVRSIEQVRSKQTGLVKQNSVEPPPTLVEPPPTLYELGSGNGRVAFFLAEHTHYQVIGVEKNRLLFWFSQLQLSIRRQLNRFSRFFTIFHKTPHFVRQDMFLTDLRNAQVVYNYTSPRVLEKITPKFEAELKPGTILISWRYPFSHPQFELIDQLNGRHTMFIYRKQ